MIPSEYILTLIFTSEADVLDVLESSLASLNWGRALATSSAGEALSTSLLASMRVRIATVQSLLASALSPMTLVAIGLGGISVYSHYCVIYFLPCGIIIVHQKYLLPRYR